MSGGSWAQRVAVPVGDLAPIPDHLGISAAATLPVAGLTAYRTLQQSEMIEGRRVLVTGASGGVGRFAVQLAAHWGAEVSAIVGSPDRAAGLAELGASTVLIGMPDEGPYDIVLESVGGESLARALAAVAPGGLVVSFGNSSREPTEFRADHFFPHHGARLQGFVLGPELDRVGGAAHDLAALAVLAAEGNLDPQIDLERPWQDAAEVIGPAPRPPGQRQGGAPARRRRVAVIRPALTAGAPRFSTAVGPVQAVASATWARKPDSASHQASVASSCGL